MKSQKISGIEHFVYEGYDEFRDAYNGNPPALVPEWTEAVTGDWVQADDGGIVQILHQQPMKNTADSKNFSYSNGYCRTVVGTFVQREGNFMDTDFDLHPSRYSFGGKPAEDRVANRRHREKMSTKDKEFVLAILSGKDPHTACQDVFGTTPLYVKKRVKELLSSKRIMMALQQNIDEVCEELGISYKWILTEYMELVDGCRLRQR